MRISQQVSCKASWTSSFNSSHASSFINHKYSPLITNGLLQLNFANMEAAKKSAAVPQPKFGPTLMPMHYLQTPGMRGLRSPSRESIASDFSVMSMSSQYADGGMRRKRMQYLSKSRETLNSGFDQLSLNVSVDIPIAQVPEGVSPVRRVQETLNGKPQVGRCFSFTDLRSGNEQEPNDECPAAISDPSLSVNSDFDDEISMFFDDKGEPINYKKRKDENGENTSLLDNETAAEPLPSAIVAGKNSKLRNRIKRKFFNFSFNELIRRRRSKKSSAMESDAQSSTGSPSPKPEKRIHINVFPEPDTMKTLTDRDIEREQGKALSKYSRNLMIFNWLHNTEETWFHSQMQ